MLVAAVVLSPVKQAKAVSHVLISTCHVPGRLSLACLLTVDVDMTGGPGSAPSSPAQSEGHLHSGSQCGHPQGAAPLLQQPS